MIGRTRGWILRNVVGAAMLCAALVIPSAAWAAGGGQWKLAEAGGTTCFNLLVDGRVEGPRILGSRQALQEAFGEREVIYATSEAAGLTIGDRMQAVRNTGAIEHPARAEDAGEVLEVLGVVEVIDVNQDVAMLRVEGACRELEIGDVLRPLPDEGDLPEELPRMPVFDADFLVTPSEADGFFVLGALESVRAEDEEGELEDRKGVTQYEMYAQRDLLVMDQGANTSWQRGDVALVYRDRVYAGSSILRDSLLVPIALGRGVVVRVDGSSAVLQLVDSYNEIQLGDRARKIGTVWDYVNNPPTIACRSERDTVRYGEAVRLTAEASDPDGDDTAIRWSAADGSLSASQGATVTWTADALDASTREAGIVQVIATADDGRDEGTADCVVSLALAPPPTGAQAVIAAGEEAEVLEFTCPEFPLGVTEVDNRCKALLDEVALRLRQDPRATVELVGHSDATGTDETNQATSTARAESARTYLVETHGLEQDRISVSGAGSSMPIADNETPEGRLSNRRVEIRVTIPGGTN